MSRYAILKISESQAFAPRTRFHELAHDHVPFDVLIGADRHEHRLLQTITDSTRAAVVVAPRGGGKSSLIAHVCGQLPDSHIALRVPVTGADDPSSVSAVAAVALSTALAALELEDHQQRALEQARADQAAQTTVPRRIGGKLGGGPIPVELSGELQSLSVELTTNHLAAERLFGLDRLISILAYRGLTPIFVIEDTEAVIGGTDGLALADGFFRGPVKAFIQELDASTVIAVQSHIAQHSDGFKELEPTLRRIDVPDFGDLAVDAIRAIATARIEASELDLAIDNMFGSGALELLADWYSESGRSLRHTLAALQSAADHAADENAQTIDQGYIRAGAADWRPRLP